MPLFGNSLTAEMGNGFVPHNKSRNLSVHTSFSARNAAASRHLFGATKIMPRSYRVVGGDALIAPLQSTDNMGHPVVSEAKTTSGRCFLTISICRSLYLIYASAGSSSSSSFLNMRL